MIDHAPQYIEGEWYVPVEDLIEALDALERLERHVTGIYKRASVYDVSHALDEARAILKASYRL